jgi:hypothetical protein
MKIREVRIVESRGNWASMLLEDRADYIATNLKAKLEAAAQKDDSYPTPAGKQPNSQDIVSALKKADPDPQGKNLQFIANMYISGQFKMEDLNQVKTDIDKFKKSQRTIIAKLKEPGNEELLAKYPNGVADLLQLKSLNDLYDLADLAGGAADVSGKEVARQEMQGANKVIDTPNFKVYIPQNEEAACRIGSGTRWCTAGDSNNRFTHYHSQGPLYIIMAKAGGKLRKWQLHYESGQFMDERDSAINQADIALLSKIPEYTDFLNCLIVKYYGKYLPPEETKGKCKYPV